MGQKYYAVKVGKKPGIYQTWSVCKTMVEGVPGAIYKSFPTIAEAKQFLGGTIDSGKNKKEMIKPIETTETKLLDKVYAFVDGSYNSITATYGYGGFLVAGDKRYVLQGSGKESDMAAMRNVAGEILGSKAAVEKALELGIKELAIYYDYMGIEMWAIGAWKRNKKGTIAYYEYMQSVKEKIKVSFIKVKGHSGIEGNEEADRLAKESVGIL